MRNNILFMINNKWTYSKKIKRTPPSKKMHQHWNKNKIPNVEHIVADMAKYMIDSFSNMKDIEKFIKMPVIPKDYKSNNNFKSFNKEYER